MSVRVEVVCVNPDSSEQRREVLTIQGRELAMETLGLNLSEGKALLAGVQDVMVAQQVQEHLARRRVCPYCHHRYTNFRFAKNYRPNLLHLNLRRKHLVIKKFGR